MSCRDGFSQDVSEYLIDSLNICLVQGRWLLTPFPGGDVVNIIREFELTFEIELRRSFVPPELRSKDDPERGFPSSTVWILFLKK